MPVTINGTAGVTFNDATTQGTAAVSWPGLYTGTDVNNTSFPVGSFVLIPNTFAMGINNNTTKAIFSAFSTFVFYSTSWPLAGTWRSRGAVSLFTCCSLPHGGLFQRVA
jgi:hypothetical protein